MLSLMSKTEVIQRVRDANGGKVKVKFKVNPRMGAAAPPGQVIAGFDFSSEEIMIAAVWSGDPIMLDVFRQPEEMTAPDGSIVANPLADMHTLTTKDCCFPHLFLDKEGLEIPQWMWVKTAKNKELITQKGDPRGYGKTLNFGVLYGQGPESISELYSVLVELATSWVERHKKTYFVFHQWKEEISEIANARGWIETPFTKRIRWCVESNAKAAGESPGVMAVNQTIRMSPLLA